MTTGEWKQFLGHARGSLYELESHQEAARRLGFFSEDECKDLHAAIENTGRPLAGLIRHPNRSV